MTRRRLLVAWIVVFTILVAFAISQNRKLGEQGREAHDALCVFKGDIEQRAQASRDFLADNPDGLPGIPASVIRTSLANQQKTVDSLRTLDC